ncbi:MAG: ABC transporter permease [Vulcanimicrobiaceae bacterium]
MNYLLGHPERIAALAAAHAAIVVTALTVALAIALPLGIVSARYARIRPLLLGGLGAIYTIPSLALLALLVQLFGLGIAPIFVALVAYGQFMLVRNIDAGLRGIDPAARDAACGIGLSPNQSLVRVEIPLALPVMIGGLRITAIAMIAMATLAGYVGGGGLGVLIFNGLTLHNNAMIVAGSLAVCAMAIAVDAALRACEGAARKRVRA